jgi:hypothetical protein
MNEKLATIDVRQRDILSDVRDNVKAINRDLVIYQIHEERGNDIHELEALQEMVLVGADEGQVTNDQDYHTDVFN